MKLEWKTCFKVGLSIFLLYLCIHYWPTAAAAFSAFLGAAAPLFIGCIIAYLVNILMSLYERIYFPRSKKSIVQKSRRVVCMVASFITLLAVVALIVSLVVPQLTSCIQLIFAELPDAITKLIARMDELDLLPEDIIELLKSIDWQSRIGQIINMLTSGIGNVMEVVVSTVSSVFSGIVTGLLSVIFSFYILLGKDRLAGQFDRLMTRYIKPKWYGRIQHLLSIMNDCFRKYIIGQCTEAVILGLLCTIGMLILRLPYATMIGALIAFTALIPVAGAYIGAAVGAFMILTVSPVKALIFLIFLVVLQQFEGNLIYPRVVGSSMGLPGIWVLAAVTVGGGLMGVTGMLLGVPLAATAYQLLRENINQPAVESDVLSADNQIQRTASVNAQGSSSERTETKNSAPPSPAGNNIRKTSQKKNRNRSRK